MNIYFPHLKIQHFRDKPVVDSAYSSRQLKKAPLLRSLADSFRQKSSRPVLFSHGRKTQKFFTEDSRLYITPREQELIDKGIKLNRSAGKWDSLSSRIAREYQKQRKKRDADFSKDLLLEKFDFYRARISENIREKSRQLASSWSLAHSVRNYGEAYDLIEFRRIISNGVKLWNFSLIGAIVLGMVLMTLIYKFLGPQARAGDIIAVSGKSSTVVIDNSPVVGSSRVSGAETAKNPEKDSAEETDYISEVAGNLEKNKKKEFEDKAKSMVEGYPIEKMLPYILEKDRKVAAFLIAIARKESSWGVHVPVLNGQDCYNYWGYRGQRKLMGTGGHTCFNSRKDAVDTVAKRLDWLINGRKLNTPAKLVIWKCGSACHKDDQVAVRKWISDVDLYFGKLND